MKHENYSAYTRSKIDHLRRIGLISGKNSGYGENGGACPDWLASEQKARREAMDKGIATRIRRASQHIHVEA